MIKALFFDLDGTLLNSQSHISENTKHALRLCKEKDIQCYIATGRTKALDKMLPDWTKETFDLFDGGVFCNGACRIIHKKQDYVFIEQKAVQKCIEIVNQFENIHFVLQMEDEVHAFNYEFNEAHIDEWGLQDRKIVQLSRECEKKTVKIMIYTKNLVDRTEKLPVELFTKLKNEIGDCSTLYLTDHGEVIMIAPASVSKYSSIEEIRKKLQLNIDEIAVFGDDFNDLEMLSTYPNSVAMGNAKDEIKKAAAYTTSSNNQDGVVDALKNIFKLI